MQSFYALYNRLTKASVENRLDDELVNINKIADFDEKHLDCLLNPDKHPTVFSLSQCSCTEEEKAACEKICTFDAVTKDEKGNISISDDLCTGCANCIKNCNNQNLVDRKDIVPLFKLLNNSTTPVYAMIAPAFIGQFNDKVTPGKLRNAFKKLGFSGMIEVALFADILTLKEALEFDHSIQTNEDYLLTSCCCPIWIGMIKKVYSELIPHVPPSVSPMVACGRSIKKLTPGAKTVFIGPCIAKKAEAREKDINDAVDFVLTFQEVQDIFEIANINPEDCEEDLKDHSSTGGRIYARTGGVSEAVQNTVKRLSPDRNIPLKAQQANGVPECKALLNKIKSGDIKANFIEGMGCVGGCVGGPKAIISREKGIEHVNTYGEKAIYKTPVDNPYVIELLHRLGFDTIQSLLEKDNLFIRNLD